MSATITAATEPTTDPCTTEACAPRLGVGSVPLQERRLQGYACVVVEPKHVLTIVAVEDLERAAAFYGRALGWRRSVDAPTYVELEGPAGMRIGLYDRAGFGRNIGRLPARIARGDVAPTELYFYVDDLDEAIGRMRDADATVLSPRATRDWGDEAVYFADPDGNVVVLARPMREGED